MTTSSTQTVRFLPFLKDLQVNPGPCHAGGNSYRDMSLFEKRSHQMGFRGSSTAVLYTSVILFMAAASFTLLWRQEGGPDWIILAVFPVLGVGLWSAYRAGHRITFDKKLGLVWGGGRPNKASDRHGRRFQARISDIVALQLVRKLAKNGRGERLGSLVSYELNLVYQDCSRNNLVDHSDFKTLLAETKKLAAFLSLPVLATFDLETELKSGFGRWFHLTFG